MIAEHEFPVHVMIAFGIIMCVLIELFYDVPLIDRTKAQLTTTET